jgi:putative ABC transport system permease protein
MAEEMRQHLDELTKANIAAGMEPEEARFAAQRRFGGIAQIEERCRDEHGFVGLDLLSKDVLFVVRSLCRARGYSLTVLFTLILGIGVTAAVYEITAWIIFRASPYPTSEQLFFLGFNDKQGSSGYYRFGFQLQAYREQTSVFSEYAAVENSVSNVVVGGQPVAASVNNVSTDCFRTLGIAPVLGRAFLPEEFRAGANNVVVITDLFWRKHLNAARDALGTKLLIDKQACVIVGVLEQGQSFPQYFGADVYRPLVFKLDPANVFDPTLEIIGRLKPGITRDMALGALSTVKLPPLQEWESVFFVDQRPILTNVTELNRPDIYWVMFAAAALLFAIACLNAMNLTLIRLLGRRRELSIRFAVGGSRWQVVRLIVVENLVLSLFACLVVMMVARWCFPPLLTLLNGDDSSFYLNYWDWRTLSFICGLSLFACVVTALAPALRLSRANINTGLKDGGPTIGESRRAGRIRNSLVIFQAAFAVILLTGTGLMVRSFDKLHRVDLGFNPDGKMKVSIQFPRGYELRPEERLQLFERLQRRLSVIPGVEAVSFGQDSLLEGEDSNVHLQMADGTFRPAANNFVSADYQQTAGLVIKEGRWLSGKRGVLEVVINEALAKARFGDKDPIGQSIRVQVTGNLQFPVVGVVKNVRETMRSSPGMHFYTAAWNFPPGINALVLRLGKDPKKEFADVVRRAIYEVDPNLISPDIRSINQEVTDSMWAENYAYTVLKGLAAVALGLTVVGLFSVIAYTVNVRMTELGVRLAVGASPSDLNLLILLRGLAAAAAGITIGMVGAFGLTRFMRSMLFETNPFDPFVYLAAALLLLAATFAACWLPARRAARVDVVKLLRTD